MPRPYSDSEINDAVRLYKSGKSFEQVATEIGRPGCGEPLRLALKFRGIELPRNTYASPKRIPAPPDLADRYASKESVLSMSAHYGVDRSVVTRWLTEEGLKPRSSAESAKIRMGRMSRAERSRLTTSAHDAIRGTRRPDVELAKRALTRETTFDPASAKDGPGVNIIKAALMAADFNAVREKAVGKYNLDIAVPDVNVAVEVLGGNWHGSKSTHRQRTPYILNAGWSVLFVWDVSGFPITARAAQQVVTYCEKARVDPPSVCEYRMIRGDGEFMPGGGSDLNKFALVPPTRSSLNSR